MNILNKKTGFTLMEIMITLIIISLLVAAGVPYYKDHIERQKAALGVTDLKMIADSVERYMALHSENIPATLSLLDADIDHDKLSADHTTYNNGSFTFSIQGNTVVAGRNTGEYTLKFCFDDTDPYYGISCESSDPEVCQDKLKLCDL